MKTKEMLQWFCLRNSLSVSLKQVYSETTIKVLSHCSGKQILIPWRSLAENSDRMKSGRWHHWSSLLQPSSICGIPHYQSPKVSVACFVWERVGVCVGVCLLYWSPSRVVQCFHLLILIVMFFFTWSLLEFSPVFEELKGPHKQSFLLL